MGVFLNAQMAAEASMDGYFPAFGFVEPNGLLLLLMPTLLTAFFLIMTHSFGLSALFPLDA
jgi:hypothetical protein